MTGNDAWQVQWPVPGAVPISDLAAAVHARVGGLVGAEPTQLYGAVTAASIGTDPDTMLIPGQRIEDLAAVLLAGRARACPFCGAPLAMHTLTVDPDEVGIWCQTAATSRPAAEWLAGPPPVPSAMGPALMWVGIPALSMGLLSWLPALIAGLRHRRRSWLIAAATFGALTAVVVGLVPAESASADESLTAAEWLWFLLVVGLWMGSTIYGARQVKPWLATQPPPGTANSTAPRDVAIAYALMLPSLLGICGIQHFYLGKIGRGVLWLMTFGLFGIGLVVDLFTMPRQVSDVNARRAPAIR